MGTNSIISASILDGEVTSADINNQTIVNEDVSPSAAIAGTKILPNFGNQNIVTTGTSKAGSFVLQT